jgi:hypothetical protein
MQQVLVTSALGKVVVRPSDFEDVERVHVDAICKTSLELSRSAEPAPIQKIKVKAIDAARGAGARPRVNIRSLVSKYLPLDEVKTGSI